MKRGAIWSVTLDPSKGREQQGTRPVLIVSSDAFNRVATPIVCPIASAAMGQRMAGFTVSLTSAGTMTTGVVLCAQVRALDVRARGGRRIEDVPNYITDDVLSCLQDLFEV